MQSNNAHAAQYVSNDATSATHLTHSSSDQSEDSDETRSTSGEISSYARVGQNADAESLVASVSDQSSGKHFESISDDASLEDAAPDVAFDRAHVAGGDPSGSLVSPRKRTELDVTKVARLALDARDIFDQQDLITREGHLNVDDALLPGKLDNCHADNDIITTASCPTDVIGSVDESDSVSDYGKVGYRQQDGSSYDSSVMSGSGMSGSGPSSSGGCYSPAEKPTWGKINSKAANIDPNNPVIRCSDGVTMPINEMVTEVAGCPPHRDVSDRLDSVAGEDNYDVDNDTVTIASADGKPNADESDPQSDYAKDGYGPQDGSSYDASGTSSSSGCYSPSAWQHFNSTAASIDPNNPVTC